MMLAIAFTTALVASARAPGHAIAQIYARATIVRGVVAGPPPSAARPHPLGLEPRVRRCDGAPACRLIVTDLP